MSKAKRSVTPRCRERVAGLSSGVYYNSVGDFFNSLQEVLLQEGYRCGSEEFYIPRIYNDSGHTLLPLETLDPSSVGVESCLWFSWYRMPSFRWEFIVYVT